jgi:hypothetical protein
MAGFKDAPSGIRIDLNQKDQTAGSGDEEFERY